MAKTRHGLLCILVFLLSVSGCALGFNGIQYLNEKNDMWFQNTITFQNHTRLFVPPGTTLLHLPNGTAWDYAVPNNTVNILTAFEMVNASGHYYQDVFTWSRIKTPWVPCVTNCSWKIDEHGFSVADLAHGGHPQFMVSWSGPYPGN